MLCICMCVSLHFYVTRRLNVFGELAALNSIATCGPQCYYWHFAALRSNVPHTAKAMCTGFQHAVWLEVNAFSLYFIFFLNFHKHHLFFIKHNSQTQSLFAVTCRATLTTARWQNATDELVITASYCFLFLYNIFFTFSLLLSPKTSRITKSNNTNVRNIWAKRTHTRQKGQRHMRRQSVI